MFWHVFAKSPRHTRQNAITEGDLECILARNCEGTEQLRVIMINHIDVEGNICLKKLKMESVHLMQS